MSETKCDVCSKVCNDMPFEIKERTGEWSFDYELWDICFAECLAVAAARLSRQAGVEEENAAVQSKVANAPAKVRKWWQR